LLCNNRIEINLKKKFLISKGAISNDKQQGKPEQQPEQQSEQQQKRQQKQQEQSEQQ